MWHLTAYYSEVNSFGLNEYVNIDRLFARLEDLVAYVLNNDKINDFNAKFIRVVK